MKSFKQYLRESEDSAYVYRTCVLKRNPETNQLEVQSFYDPSVITPISIGEPLRGKFYVGTKAKFPLAYYTGMTDIEEGETEVLLTLRVPVSTIPDDESFMGQEVVVEDPIVVKIENVSDAENKQEYQ
jgi:hypothetical protein